MQPLCVLYLLLLPLVRGAPISNSQAMEFLQTFGYIHPARMVAEGAEEEEDPITQTRNAIKMYQEMEGIAVTGVFDEVTKESMVTPRCGVHDVAALTEEDFMAMLPTWLKKNLTFSINNTDSGMSDDETRNAIRSAFDAYSAVIPLKFEEVSSGADIKLSFGRKEHGDGSDFDGKGNTLAHARMPQTGIIHFDADEPWTVMNATNLRVDTHNDFLTTAIHEIGHALGYQFHAKDKSSIMASKYKKPKDKVTGKYVEPKLDSHTIAYMRTLYGTAKEPKPIPKNVTSCAEQVYGVLDLPYGHVMLFPEKGYRILEIDGATRTIVQNMPVKQVFTKGPTQVMSAYYRDNMIMLFHAKTVWGYKLTGKKVELAVGYPKELPVEEDWQTDGAFPYVAPAKTHLISRDKQIATYDERSNKVEKWGNFTTDYKNFPKEAAGRAKFNKQEGFIYFTDKRIFKHDFGTEITDDLGTISEFLNC